MTLRQQIEQELARITTDRADEINYDSRIRALRWVLALLPEAESTDALSPETLRQVTEDVMWIAPKGFMTQLLAHADAWAQERQAIARQEEKK